MGDELHICATCVDYTPVTTGSGHCDLTDSAVFAGGGCSEWRTRLAKREVPTLILGTSLIAGIVLLLGALLFGCASDPNRYPILKPLYPVTNQEIQTEHPA
jgi:hypothetical protein